MTSARYCRTKTRRSRSSFFLPLLFLTPPQRAAMYALYAFCREVDDIVDTGMPKEDARLCLSGWRRELQAAFAGIPSHPASSEIAHYQRLLALPTHPFYDLLDGMEMDLEQTRYQTWEDLTTYCQRVAVAVGVVAVHIFFHEFRGEGRETIPIGADHYDFAYHLGMALQLTNILRDVAEDAAMGRIYLPQQLLAEMGVEEEDIWQSRWSTPLAQALGRVADRAMQHYQRADDLIASPKERCRLLPAFLMSGIYQAHLERLRRKQFNCFTELSRFSVMDKIVILWRTWWREKRLGWCLLWRQ